MLDRFLPLSVIELSHLAGSAVGVLLLILAHGLMRRLDGAWQVTMSLLGAGIVASLLKGLDYEEALLLAAAMLPLWWTRKQFYRKSSLLAEPLSAAWLASASIAIGAATWVGLLAYRHVPYASELWWQFELDGQAPRMLRASLLAVLLLGTFAAYRLLAPARPRRAFDRRPTWTARCPSSATPRTPRPIWRCWATSRCCSATPEESFLMYGIARRSWVAMGDPVGSAEEREELVWSFRELADRAGAWSVFYQVSPEHLPLYVDAGLGAQQAGRGGARAARRHSRSTAARARSCARRTAGRERDGLSFRDRAAADVAPLLPACRQISDDWLRTKSAAEKGFSLGASPRTTCDTFRWHWSSTRDGSSHSPTSGKARRARSCPWT